MIYEVAMASGRKASRLKWYTICADNEREATIRFRMRFGPDTKQCRLHAGPMQTQCKHKDCKASATVLRNGWWPTCQTHATVPLGWWDYRYKFYAPVLASTAHAAKPTSKQPA
jgi:hypothetical protein